MYADNTLTPKEAVRLCALGSLAVDGKRYSELAASIRHFTDRVLGPSLDVMAPSLELLKFEGLVTPLDGKGMEDDARLEITEAGREELRTLLTANVRAGAQELNKLVLALKFRFLHLLPVEDQRAQVELLIDVTDSEVVRLTDLRQHHAGDAGLISDWLDHDLQQLEARTAWLKNLDQRLSVAGA